MQRPRVSQISADRVLQVLVSEACLPDDPVPCMSTLQGCMIQEWLVLCWGAYPVSVVILYNFASFVALVELHTVWFRYDAKHNARLSRFRKQASLEPSDHTALLQHVSVCPSSSQQATEDTQWHSFRCGEHRQLEGDRTARQGSFYFQVAGSCHRPANPGGYGPGGWPA